MTAPVNPGCLNLLSTNWTVIVAVMMRETRTRFGRNKLGYLWAFVEPAAYVAILLLVRTQIRATVPFGENLFLFLLTGLLVFRMFMSIAGRTLNAITANQALFTFPIVKPVDAIFARVILEAVTMLVVVSVFFTFLILVSPHGVISYPQRMSAALGATILLSGGVGTLNAVAAALMPAWERMWSIMRLPLLLLSGVFYVPKSLPPMAQDVLYWNPLLHCVEWLRYATYLDYDPVLNTTYVLSFGVAAMTIGLALEKTFRNKVLQG